MRNGAQADESTRREAQEEADRARRDQSGVGLVVVARRTLRLRRRRHRLLQVGERDWCSDNREENNKRNKSYAYWLTCKLTNGVCLTCYIGIFGTLLNELHWTIKGNLQYSVCTVL